MCYCVRPSGAGAINEMPLSDDIEIFNVTVRYLEEAVIAGWQHSVGDEQAPEGAGAHRAKAEADGAVLGLQY